MALNSSPRPTRLDAPHQCLRTIVEQHSRRPRVRVTSIDPETIVLSTPAIRPPALNSRLSQTIGLIGRFSQWLAAPWTCRAALAALIAFSDSNELDWAASTLAGQSTAVLRSRARTRSQLKCRSRQERGWIFSTANCRMACPVRNCAFVQQRQSPAKVDYSIRADGRACNAERLMRQCVRSASCGQAPRDLGQALARRC